MFRVSQHPSSGVLKTVTAASGTGHNNCIATPLQRGLIGTGLCKSSALTDRLPLQSRPEVNAVTTHVSSFRQVKSDRERFAAIYNQLTNQSPLQPNECNFIAINGSTIE